MSKRMTRLVRKMTMADQYHAATEDVISQGFGNGDHRADCKRLNRMRMRSNRKRYLCYPEDRFKNYWDTIVAIALIIACTTTPVFIAFNETQIGVWSRWDTLNITLDAIFGLDIIVVFLTVYYDD